MFSMLKCFSTRIFKPALVETISRMKILRGKKSIELKKKKISVAQSLVDNKVEKARLETESIVRDDFFVEALDIVEPMCAMVRDNVELILSSKDCPPNLIEPVCTLLYVAERVDIEQLNIVKKQLQKIFGECFCEAARSNSNKNVNEGVVARLSDQRPNAYIVLAYMKKIAAEKELHWEPDQETETTDKRTDSTMVWPSGTSVLPGSASGLGLTSYSQAQTHSLEPKPSVHANVAQMSSNETVASAIRVEPKEMVTRGTQTDDVLVQGHESTEIVEHDQNQHPGLDYAAYVDDIAPEQSAQDEIVAEEVKPGSNDGYNDLTKRFERLQVDKFSKRSSKT